MSFYYYRSRKKQFATNEEIRRRVKLAQAVLGAKADPAAIKDTVHAVLAKQAYEAALRVDKNKKKAVNRIAQALHRLDMALNNSSVPSRLRDKFPREELRQLRATCQSMGKLALG